MTAGGVGSTDPEVSPADQRAARKEMARIERQIEKLTAEEGRLHDEMAAQATDHEVILKLDARLRELGAERVGLEEQWLTVSELV
jgi:hypothetical protein